MAPNLRPDFQIVVDEHRGKLTKIGYSPDRVKPKVDDKGFE